MNEPLRHVRMAPYRVGPAYELELYETGERVLNRDRLRADMYRVDKGKRKLVRTTYLHWSPDSGDAIDSDNVVRSAVVFCCYLDDTATACDEYAFDDAEYIADWGCKGDCEHTVLAFENLDGWEQC